MSPEEEQWPDLTAGGEPQSGAAVLLQGHPPPVPQEELEKMMKQKLKMEEEEERFVLVAYLQQTSRNLLVYK